MFKIGEFSRIVRVSPRMLRHYEKCGIIYPAEIDRFTGYRAYSAAQIPLLTNIAMLRDMGFSIDEIADILPKLQDESYMDRIAQLKSASIQRAIDVEQHKLELLSQLNDRLRRERRNMVYDVELKSLPSVKVLALREVISAYDQEGMLWHKLGQFVHARGIASGEGGYSIYHDDEHKDSDVDVEIAMPVDVLGKSEGEFVYKELAAIENAAVVRFSGPYDGGYEAASSKLGEWLEKNDYEFAGHLTGHAISFPMNQEDPNGFLTELQVAVRKK